jgi:hypothetical protein
VALRALEVALAEIRLGPLEIREADPFLSPHSAPSDQASIVAETRAGRGPRLPGVAWVPAAP